MAVSPRVRVRRRHCEGVVECTRDARRRVARARAAGPPVGVSLRAKGPDTMEASCLIAGQPGRLVSRGDQMTPAQTRARRTGPRLVASCLQALRSRSRMEARA